MKLVQTPVDTLQNLIVENKALRADLEAVAVAAEGLLALLKVGGVVETETALDKLYEALARPGVQALLEGEG